MLARIAQELFWLGRDVARADHTARMLDGVFHTDLQGRGDGPSGEVTLTWEALMAIIGARQPESRQAAAGATDLIPAMASPADRATVVARLTLDLDNPASVRACVARARERARTLRDVISTEMWEALNTFHLDLAQQSPAGLRTVGPYSTYRLVKQRCALFTGLASRTMMRDEARCFLEAGERLESADMVLRMLRVALPPDALAAAGERTEEDVDEEDTRPTLAGEALALLHAVGGFQAYRRSMRQPPTAAPVAMFLLFDRGYPGSVAAALDVLEGALVDADPQARTSEPVLRLARLRADLEFQQRATPDGATLARLLGRVQEELVRVDKDIADRYFAGSESPTPVLTA